MSKKEFKGVCLLCPVTFEYPKPFGQGHLLEAIKRHYRLFHPDVIADPSKAVLYDRKRRGHHRRGEVSNGKK